MSDLDVQQTFPLFGQVTKSLIQTCVSKKIVPKSIFLMSVTFVPRKPISWEQILLNCFIFIRSRLNLRWACRPSKTDLSVTAN